VVETVIFAMLAAFLGLRLYAVLGKRTGHEQTIAEPVDDSSKLAKPPVAVDDVRDGGPTRVMNEDPLDGSVLSGIRAISAADPKFSADDFIQGATSAYQMLLEAFWAGDANALQPYVGADVLEAFSDAIAARKRKKEVLDNRLIRIERATISHAELVNKVARVTVRFDADISAVTRNAKGDVIAGSTSDALPTHDVWTFERQVRASDPNWTLVDTDESA
jgi:predicted lipid-binding transport protein (Tim44 family)